MNSLCTVYSDLSANWNESFELEELLIHFQRTGFTNHEQVPANQMYPHQRVLKSIHHIVLFDIVITELK